MKTSCDVCLELHFCQRCGKVYRADDGHWYIRPSAACAIDEDVERQREYTLQRAMNMR